MRVLSLSLAVLACAGCATARPPPSECRLIETTERPCEPVPWLDGPAFVVQRREHLAQELKAWSMDAGRITGPLSPVGTEQPGLWLTDGGPVDFPDGG